jgi:zinc transport system substrate-binding protein
LTRAGDAPEPCAVANRLAPFAESEFLVLHDAHIYFERRFGMRAHGAITIEPDVMPTAAKIKKISA